MKSASTPISATSTTNPARAAIATPARFKAVVAANAISVNTQAGTEGTSACSAMPEKR